MRIRRHRKSYIVELADYSVWRIWPGDIAKTLQWRPQTELDVMEIAHEICSHALVDRSDGLQVRVIDARLRWPVDIVRQLLGSSGTAESLHGGIAGVQSPLVTGSLGAP